MRSAKRVDRTPVDAFALVCRAEGLPEPWPELVFAHPRRWRFDYAWPDHLIALEVEGGVFTCGRHTRGAGFVKDLEKYSEAAIAGWCVVRVTPNELLTRGVDLVKRAIQRGPIRVANPKAKGR
jgi:hypothetical protein